MIQNPMPPDSDVFRQEYTQLSEEQEKAIKLIKGTAEELMHHLRGMSPSREISLAVTNLEQAVMWAVKGVTK